MKKLIITLIILGVISNLYSQNGLIWSQNFQTGLPNYYLDLPEVQVDHDTIKVIGRSNAIEPGQQLLMIGYNTLGDTLFTRNYGQDSVSNNVIMSYAFDKNKNLYLLHRDYLGFYKSKIVIQKYSCKGNLLWVDQIKSLADTSFNSCSLALINDTTLLVTAHKETDYPFEGDDVFRTKVIPLIYVFNTNGIKLWEKELDANTEINYFISDFIPYNKTSDIIPYNNTAILFGYNSSIKPCMVKVGLDEKITSTEILDLENGINHVQLTNDSNLLITSSTSYRVSKINMNGVKIWSDYYQTNSGSDEITSMIQDREGNIFITGRHYGVQDGTNADILTIKYDKDGLRIWENRYEFGKNNADIGNYVTFKNGNIYVGGESQRLGAGTDYDYVVLKLDSVSGKNIGTYRYNGTDNGDDAVSSIDVFDDGRVVLTGLSKIGSTYNWTTQFLSDVKTSNSTFTEFSEFEIYPNPINRNGYLKIRNSRYKNYCITSINGEKMINGDLINQNTNAIGLTNLPSGIYFLTLTNDQETVTEKIVIK